jgi:hypothetical protein
MKEVGDTIQLAEQEVEVIECEECGELMVNIDESQLKVGDLKLLKQEGVRVSNPNTEDDVCIDCEIEREDKEHDFKRKVSSYYKSSDDDDSSFHHSSPSSGGFSFGGGGGFGGFGGGSFSGGGASGGY